MCGRSRCSLSPQQVVNAARVPDDRWKGKQHYVPSHNVAPGYNTPVVKRDKQQELEVHTMKWGLVPSFTKSTSTEKPDHFRMFNARCETVAEKTVFSRLLHRQRCIVMFDGFYEWKKENTRKQPFYVNMGEGNVMRMAGLFDVWSSGPDAAPLYTYTILTTDSSKRLQWLHDRMPVILTSDEHAEAWLGTEALSDKMFDQLCVPYNGEDLVWHPVTPSMSSMSYQSADASQNMELKKGNIASFFKGASVKAAKSGAKKTTSGSSKQSPTTHAQRLQEQPAAAMKTDVANNHRVRLDTSNAKSAADLASDAHGDRQHMEQSDLHSAINQAKSHIKAEVIDLAGADTGKAKAEEGDVLNTDDAGGIVAKPEPEPGGALHDSPSSAKRSAPSSKSPAASTTSAKKRKTEKGTIKSFFSPQK